MKKVKTNRFDVLIGLDDSIQKRVDNKIASAPARARTAPGQLMQFTTEAVAYEDRIKALEIALADSLRSEIPVDLIDPNPWQPRTHFDPKEISGLAASINEQGLIQPIIVRRVPNGDTLVNDGSVPIGDTRYELIAGERRLRAHKELGKKDIKCIVIEAANDEMAMMALAENLDREDLTDYEIGKAIKRAEKEFPNKKNMAQSIGKSRSELYRYLSFLSLPEHIKKDLEDNPGLLGSHASEMIVSFIKEKGKEGADAINNLWSKVKDGQLDQLMLTSSAEAFLKGKTVRTNRDIKKLFVDTIQVGSITRDHKYVTVKLKDDFITEETLPELHEFIQKLVEKGAKPKT